MVFDRPFEISNRVVVPATAGLPADSVGVVVGIHYDARGTAGWVVRVRFPDDEIGAQDIEFAASAVTREVYED